MVRILPATDMSGTEWVMLDKSDADTEAFQIAKSACITMKPYCLFN